MEFMNEQSSDLSKASADIDVESLLSEINAPVPERAMTSEEAMTQEQPAQTQQPAAVTPQEYEFDWNGRKVKAPLEKLTKWASQGYDYSQKMEKFKQEQAEISKIKQEYAKYKQIDDYVKKDPNWWSHVEEQYNNRLASEDPVVQRVNGMLEEKLAPFTELLAQKEQQETQARIQKEDTALSQEIKSIREKYSDLDFDTPDAEGKSLELKILEHGANNGFPSFRASFLDFYHDQLEKRWEARGREAVSKDAARQQKLGLPGTAKAPMKKTNEFDVSGLKDHNEVMKMLVRELGL